MAAGAEAPGATLSPDGPPTWLIRVRVLSCPIDRRIALCSPTYKEVLLFHILCYFCLLFFRFCHRIVVCSGNTQAKTPELQEPDASFHNRAGRGEITEDEIRLEKNIDILDENGLTGLHWAASYGQVAATTNLLRFNDSFVLL